MPGDLTRKLTPTGVLRRAGFFALVAAIVLYAVFPFYYAIPSSLKSGSDLFPENQGTCMFQPERRE